MIQINIDSKVEKCAFSYAQEMINAKIVVNLWHFYNGMMSNLDFNKLTIAQQIEEENIIGRCREYTKQVINHYEELLVLKADDFSTFEKIFSSIYNKRYKDDVFFKHKIVYGSGTSDCKAFYEHLVKCMGYPKARNCMLKYVKDLDVRVCPYCNVASAETYKDDDTWIGRYHLDHYRDKHKHPFLGVSFFNLVPSCSSCNGHKSDKPMHFYLYSKSPQKSPFQFHFFGIVHYLINGENDKIKISFEQDNLFQKQYNQIFDIELLYNEHKDELTEVLDRYYHEFGEDRIVLKESFLKLPFDEERKTKNVLGHYLNDSDIHKKSFVKMKLDLGRYLKLI